MADPDEVPGNGECNLWGESPYDIHPEARWRLDASERRYLEEAARISEQLRPQFEALLGLPEEEYQLRHYELCMLEQSLLAGPMTEWQLRNWRIVQWCERNGFG